MSSVVLYTIISLSGLGIAAALMLFLAAQKFKVYEDPRIDQVEHELPASNCGGCGFPGCRNFAEALIKAEDFEGLHCPVGGNETMNKIAELLGKTAVTQDPKVAVLRCNGACEFRPMVNKYDGTKTCSIAAALYGGETGCEYGCLGYGDCVEVCKFDALYMDADTGLPVVIDKNCTACGACVKECPKNLFELRKRYKKDRKIYVACMNEDKGGPAKKSCSVACIGCTKCVKVCTFDAIIMNNNLAFIDSELCRLCRKCAPECPTNSIIEIGFPPKKEKVVDDNTGQTTTALENQTNEENNKLNNIPEN
ncbi:MAG: Fe-S cluster domain-containing protein [Bacteroidales bacterium]|nr:MAG: Fe-S cluster domain-containing protein [Bacteroidales bacterium]